MSHGPYQFPLAHYPPVYGVSYRTILRWAEKGYPLDDEAATQALVASQKNSASAPHLSAEGARIAPAIEGAELGLAASIRRLQAAEAQAHAEYEQARASGDAGQAAARAKAWLSLSEQLRKVEQSTPEVEQANKKTIRLEDLQAELGGLFIRLRQDLDSMAGRIALELVGKDEIGIREVLKREAEEIIYSLFSCRYLEGGEDE